MGVTAEDRPFIAPALKFEPSPGHQVVVAGPSDGEFMVSVSQNGVQADVVLSRAAMTNVREAISTLLQRDA